MNILATDFHARSLLKFIFPTMLMMVFMSAYTIIDGIFVANLVGEDALSAVNIVIPIVNILLAIGLMFATGGTAVMGKLMGEKREEEARSFLSLMYMVALLLGTILTILFLAFPDRILDILGADGALYSYSKEYLLSLSFFSVSFFLQVYAQSFFVLAGKPNLGFFVCFLGGITNIILDYVLISPKLFNLGIAGAGFATGIGNSVPALIGVVFFVWNKKSTLYFGKLRCDTKLLLQSMFNGMSELVSQLATAITTILFNIILLRLVGKSGVASISVILYIQMLQTALYFGYAIGIAPIISYKYGANDTSGLRKILNISFKFISVISILVIVFSFVFDDLAIEIFINKTSETFEMAKHGLRVFSLAYLFMGFNIFMSSMFTSLSNGKVSAIISVVRTLVFLVICLITLPYIIGINGVWLSVPVSELLALGVSMYYYRNLKFISDTE